jgi:hypothetical protein
MGRIAIPAIISICLARSCNANLGVSDNGIDYLVTNGCPFPIAISLVTGGVSPSSSQAERSSSERSTRVLTRHSKFKVSAASRLSRFERRLSRGLLK